MKRFGLLGEHLTHSYSPMIHAELGDYEYKLYEKNPDQLEEFLRKGEFDGLNITIPYKKTVLEYCNSLSFDAKTAGSVNTIIKNEDGTLHGDTTDAYGFTYLLAKLRSGGQESRLSLLTSPVQIANNDKILILGNGGSSQCVQIVLKDLGVKQIVIVSRDREDNYDNISRHSDAAMIINTTPVGMYPNNGISPIKDMTPFKQCRVVIDLIYNPPHTRLLFEAEKCGIPSISGLPMLVAQAKRSAELFLQSVIPNHKIGEIISKIERETRNVILIGMPGSGKTEIGKALAKKLNREFADTDAWVEKTAGKPIVNIFNEDSEEAFRKLENQALEELCKQNGLVIATGGGVIKREENRNILRQNGSIIFLNRNINELEVSGRPLSESEGVEKLAEERLPIYSAWADFTIKVRGVEDTAESIFQYWEGMYS